jgi:fructoselysine-6-P-deglycase FrlB-like protein
MSIYGHEGACVTFVAEEIGSQPECWQRALEMAAAGVGGLPEAGERVAVIGCGTSLFMARAWAGLRETAGLGETDAFAASEFPAGRRYDRVVAISRSGTTTEVLDTLRAVTSAPTVAVTADPSTPIGDVAGDLVVLDFADERSVVQTRFATTCLALLRAHVGQAPEDLVAQARDALAAPLPAAGRSQFTFLGSGWTVGLAEEAALKLREAAGAWTESYPAMEYRHGPISVTTDRSLVWFFGPQPPGLTGEVARIGAAVETSALDPLADLIRAQRLAVEVATAAGLDPDRPRNLTRSVILA